MAVYFNQGSSLGALGQTTVYLDSAVVAICPFTIVGWINPEYAGSNWGGADPVVVALVNSDPSVPDSSADSFQIKLDISGSTYRIAASIKDFLFSEDSVTGFVAMDAWHHFAGVWDGTTNQPTSVLSYLDGVAGTANSNPGARSPDGIRRTVIGGIAPNELDNRCYRAGCLADVAIYSAALSADEVAELAAGARPSEVAPESLIAWLKLTDVGTAAVNEVGATFSTSTAPSGGEMSTCETAPPYTPEPPTPVASSSVPYYIERMDNRIWKTIEDAWCVDSGLRYPMSEPDATLYVSSATGDQEIREYNIINGGSGYTAPIGQVIDLHPSGGTEATVTLSVSGGIIVTATPVVFGSGYINPSVSVLDATGVGAVIQPIISNYVDLETSTSSFTASDVGSIIRSGGGKMEVITVSTVTTSVANIIAPITYTVPNDPDNIPVPVTSGNWSMTAPVTTVSGLAHLAGMGVVALADGGVVTGLTVDDDGNVTLPVEATAITVGLPFVAQLQTMYMDLGGGPTVQTRRKDVSQVVLRVDGSRAPEIGLNQPDAAAQPNQAEIEWGTQIPGSSQTITAMTQIQFRMPEVPAGQPVPLWSGDLPISNLFSQWDAKGQIAVQQRDPVPLGVTALVSWLRAGDSTGQ